MNTRIDIWEVLIVVFGSNMADQVTPHRVFERRSRLSNVSTSGHDASSETAEEFFEQAEELLASGSQVMSSSVLQLDAICKTGEQRFKGLVFALGHTGMEGTKTLTITQRELHCHPPFGYTSRVHIVLIGNDYKVNLLGTEFISGTLFTETDVYKLCEMFSDESPLSPYKFCPGINWDHYEEHYHRVIRFHLKSVRYCSAPFQRVNSVNCKRWFTLPANAPLTEKFSNEVLCSSCRRLS